jgi:hypothetical protein
LRFKKNGDINTAGLVAYLSPVLVAEELAYWLEFMDQENKELMFFSIEGEAESHKKWVLNQHLWKYLMGELKWLP